MSTGFGDTPDLAEVMARLPAERAGRPASDDVIGKREMFALPQGVAARAFDERAVNGVPCRIIEGTGDAVVVYLHGGGYWGGDAESYDDYVRRLATASGATIVVPNYRLAPEHPYPAAVRDAFAVYLGLRRAEGDRPIVVAGDSAGGGLAAAISVASQLCGVARPDGQALLSAWLDLRCEAPSYGTAAGPHFDLTAALRARELYLGGADGEVAGADDPLASPLRAHPAIFPRTLVQVGTDDSLLDDSLEFSRIVGGAAVSCTTRVVSGRGHIWPILEPDQPESRASDEAFARFVMDVTADHESLRALGDRSHPRGSPA